MSDLGEFGLIEYLREGAPCFAGVRVPIGDDAAVVTTAPGAQLLLTCDLLFEGVHFRRAWYRDCPADLGRKALAVNISDIAAKGGHPRYCLVTLGTEPGMDATFLRGVYDGLYELARSWGISVVGWDTIRLPEGLLIDIALIGETTSSQTPLRCDARPGDLIAVTGCLGLAKAGLAVLDLEGTPEQPCSSRRLVGVPEHLLAEARAGQLVPPVRLREAWALAALGPHAMSDLSDGLADQIHHICAASGVGALISATAVPVAPAAVAVARAFDASPVSWGLWGGEDYELVVTLAPEAIPAAQQAVMSAGGVPLTVVGQVTAHGAIELELPGGERMPLASGGFDHFAQKGPLSQ